MDLYDNLQDITGTKFQPAQGSYGWGQNTLVVSGSWVPHSCGVRGSGCILCGGGSLDVDSHLQVHYF